MTRQPRIWLLVLATLMAAGGASCRNLRPPYREPAPVVFASQSTLAQITQYFNSTTMRVQQLQTTGATLSKGMLSLRADIAFERPRRFRLQAGLAGSTEIDLGSNDQVFWIWAKRGEPAAVYFCRHDQFHYSAAREVLPVQPEWIGEVLGLVYFDPAIVHQGPYPQGPDQFEIRSIIPTPQGNLTKTTRIDAHASVLQQQIFDVNGQLLASAVASQHRHDPLTGISLPHKVDIQLPTAQLSFSIQVTDYLINQLSGNPQQLWAMPRIDGYPVVDLCSAGSQPLQPLQPGPSYPPPNAAPYYPPRPPAYPTSAAYGSPPYAAQAPRPYSSYMRRE